MHGQAMQENSLAAPVAIAPTEKGPAILQGLFISASFHPVTVLFPNLCVNPHACV
jgi:hypothetical protein